jgi:hypothetical protein
MFKATGEAALEMGGYKRYNSIPRCDHEFLFSLREYSVLNTPNCDGVQLYLIFISRAILIPKIYVPGFHKSWRDFQGSLTRSWKSVYVVMEVQQTELKYYIATGTHMYYMTRTCSNNLIPQLADVPCEPGKGSCLQTLESTFWNLTRGGNTDIIVEFKEDVQKCLAGELGMYNLTNTINYWTMNFTSPYDPRISDARFIYLAASLAFESLKLYAPSNEVAHVYRSDPAWWVHDYRTSIAENHKETTFLLTAKQKFNFVTCDGVHVYWDFGFYLVPYDGESWIIMSLFVFMLSCITALAYWLTRVRTQLNYNYRRNLGKIFTETFIASFSTLVGIGTNSTVEKLAQKHSSFRTLVYFVRITLGIWTFMTIVLTNAYLGLVTSLSTAPNPQSTKWTHLDGMSGFRFYASPDFIESFSRVYDPSRKYNFPVRFHPNQPQDICVGDVEPNIYFYFRGDNCTKNNASRMTSKNPEMHRILTWFLFRDFHKMQKPQKIYSNFRLVHSVIGGPRAGQPLYYDVFVEELSSCSKNGYIGTPTQLDTFITYAKKNPVSINGKIIEIELKKGKDELLSESVGYSFQGWGGPPAFQRMQLLMQAGILQLWSKWYLMFKSKDFSNVRADVEDKTPKSLTLGSNIVTTFHIWLCCAGFCIAVFLVETFKLLVLEAWKRLIQIWNSFRHILSIVKANLFKTRLLRM